MLIGIDASRANRDHKSGTEWYSYYLIRWLAKIDAKNKYILYTDKPLKGGLLDLTTDQHLDNSNLSHGNIEYDSGGYQKLKSKNNNFKAKVLKWPFNFFWTQGRMSLEMIFNKPDLLFVPAHTLPIIHPEKSIVTIHDVGFEKRKGLYDKNQMGPEQGGYRKLINFVVKLITLGKYGANTIDYHKWSTQFALNKAKKIITVSNFSKKELIDIAEPKNNKITLEDKIKVVYNGYNKWLYRKIEEKNDLERILHKYDIEKPYILYVGRIEKKKNTPALIEAYAMLREKNKDIKHKLILVGDASHGYDEVKYMISEYLLEDEVILSGWIEENDMPCIICGADAFIFPTLYEGFGIPILQAMACGVPVAASDVASIPEIVGDAALLFNPNELNLMAESMERIIKDESLRSKLIERGQKQVKNFSWEKCARDTLNEIEGTK